MQPLSKKKGRVRKKRYGQDLPSGEYITTVCGVNYQLQYLQFPVALYPNQLRTMASETVNPIDLQVRPTFTW